MRMILGTGIIALAAYIFQQFWPWWVIAPTSFVVCLVFTERIWPAFWMGFAGIFLLWFLHAMLIHIQTHGILSDKVGQLFFLPSGWLLVLITAIIGGVVSGFSGAAAASLIRLFKPAIIRN